MKRKKQSVNVWCSMRSYVLLLGRGHWDVFFTSGTTNPAPVKWEHSNPMGCCKPYENGCPIQGTGGSIGEDSQRAAIILCDVSFSYGKIRECSPLPFSHHAQPTVAEHPQLCLSNRAVCLRPQGMKALHLLSSLMCWKFTHLLKGPLQKQDKYLCTSWWLGFISFQITF